MMSRCSPVLVLVLVGACSTSVSAIDAGSAADAATPTACPAAPPADGAPCVSGTGNCYYDRCSTTGFVSASCAASGGGGATWTVLSRTCSTACGGSSCTGAQRCVERASGALLLECRTHTCGEGPLDCDCLCGGPCSFYTTTSGEALYQCQVGCGADICP